MAWKTLSSKEKYKNRYMTITEDEVVTDHGEKVTYGIVHKDPAVWIIPWDGEKMLLIGQYRYSTKYFSWELPAGHAEQNEPEKMALLELQEETGLVANNIRQIATFHVAPGHLTQVGHVFLATELKQGERNLEPSEKGMQLKWVTIRELNNLIDNGTIQDGPTITVLKLFELYRKNTRSQ